MANGCYISKYILSALLHVTEIIAHCSVVPVSVNILENRYLLPSVVPTPLEQNSVRFCDKYLSKVWSFQRSCKLLTYFTAVAEDRELC